MTSSSWSEIQIRRIKELGGTSSDLDMSFSDKSERDRAFQALEKNLVTSQRQQLKDFFDNRRIPGLSRLESRLVETLTQNCFAQVMTPIIMSKGHLTKMSIDDDHPLAAQVYWVDKKQCLRPMLAPHLYYMLRDLTRLQKMPLQIFEIGPCFRKESKGSQHASEFTMLNLVEIGTPEDKRHERLKELAAMVMDTAGISDFDFETESSEVYGNTLDIVAGKDRLELASGAMGPHPLDLEWGITDTWVGIGFGLERLLMISEKTGNISKYSRSLSYLDGIRLNI